MKTPITQKLDSLHIHYTIKTHGKPVFTSEDAARERGVRLSQIVKTMLLIDQRDHITVAVLPGNRKLDLKKIKKLMKVKDLRFMDRESVEKRFGLVAGAIAPIGEMLTELPIFVDPAVFAEELVDISSGDPRAGVELSREDLRRLLHGATFVEITKKD